MQTINFNDKIANNGATPSGIMSAGDINTIKRVVNSNAQTVIEQYAKKSDLVKINAEYVPVSSTSLPQPSLTNGWTWLVGNTTYTQNNGASITVLKGELAIASYNGSNWSVAGTIELPDNTSELVEWSAGTYSANDTRTKDGKIFRANKTTSLVPSPTSPDWEQIGGQELPIDVSGGVASYESVQKILSNTAGYITSKPTDYVAEDGYWSSTAWIDVEANEKVEVFGYGDNGSVLAYFRETPSTTPTTMAVFTNGIDTLTTTTIVAPSNGQIKVRNRTANNKTDFGYRMQGGQLFLPLDAMDDLRSILNYFFTGEAQEVDQSSAEYGYLTNNNQFNPEPEYNKVLRINTALADVLNYDFIPVNTNLPANIAAIVGVTNDDVPVVLMQGQANGTYQAVQGQLDVSTFKQVSVCYNANRGYNTVFSIPKVGGEVEPNAVKKYVDTKHDYILSNGGAYDDTFYKSKVYTITGAVSQEGDERLTSTEKILLYKGDVVEYGVNTAFYDFAQFGSAVLFTKSGIFKELILGANWEPYIFKEGTYIATEDCYIAFSSDERIVNKGVPYIRIIGGATKREKIFTSTKDFENLQNTLFGLLGEKNILEYSISRQPEAVNGIEAVQGLLNRNGQVIAYTEGEQMVNWVYVDVPTTVDGVKADVLNMSFYRVGGVDNNTNLLGKNALGQYINILPALTNGTAPEQMALENVLIDISGYTHISFMMFKYDINKDVPHFSFVQKSTELPLASVKDYVDSKLTDAKPSGKVESETLIQVNRPSAMPIVNILGTLPTDASDARTPTSVEIEFSVDNNIVFKCKSELAIQGNWTVFFAKKGFECVLTNYEDEELKIQFGGWVPCSEFHIKAYPNDQTFARDLTACDLWAQMRRARPFPKSYIADFNAGLTIDKERENLLEQAIHYTDGFPVEFRVNGQFYGIYIWRLKKERDNYMINRDNPNHIFLDNEDVVDWTTFDHADWKVRSPRLSGYSDGGVINNPALMDKLNRWWAWFAGISNNTIDFESTVNNYLNVDSWVDWYIAKQLVGHWDSESNNVLLHSWDGVHLSINMYDCDQSFGFSQGAQVSNGIWYRTTFFFNVLYPKLRTRIIARYAELRNQKVIDMNNVYRTFRKTTDHISRDVYSLEMNKWEASNANSGRHNLRYCLNWTMARIAELDTVWSFTG